jgi:hypothetical protein
MAQSRKDGHPNTDTRKPQMLLAATIWTGAGVLLLSMGMFWMETGLGWGRALLVVIPFVLIGMAKGHFLLDRVAKRSVARIAERGPDAPIWGFYGLRTWLLVGLMMGSGIALRLLFNAEHWQFFYLGFLYVAVGVALVLASRRMWANALAAPALSTAA